MPRDGSIIVSDVREPTLAIVCEPCGRRGVYSVARLMESYGDAKLTDLLHTLAGCPKASSPATMTAARWSMGSGCRKAPGAIASTAWSRGSAPTRPCRTFSWRWPHASAERTSLAHAARGSLTWPLQPKAQLDRAQCPPARSYLATFSISVLRVSMYSMINFSSAGLAEPSG